MAKQKARVTGQGGETHQRARGSVDILSTNHGAPISDNQNQLKIGPRGPALLEDMILREKIQHFDHERIPERIVHARGSGAHGFFELYESLSEFTTADIFQTPGEKTEVFARFSTVAGGAGSVDTPRDVRGFAVKFYTREGNWDLVGNNIPVFFIQDAMKFPDLVHAVKMEADRGFPQAASAHDTFWDFVSLMPESTHMLMWAMSDRTLPRSYRMMEGFGVHTFRFVNAEGQSTFVKFHWRPTLGIQSTVWDEAVKLAGADPDYHRRDLFEAIDAGQFPEWELGVQLFDEQMAESLPYDVLDATKLIPEEIVPVQIVGRMVLNRNVDNFFAETEQAAFMPTNIVPGIDFSNDPLLQGRLFSYQDTQLKRLGSTNFHQLPINAAKGRAGCPFHNFQRDGHMQMHVPKGRANYEPNSLAEAGEDGGPRESASGFRSYVAQEQGDKLRVRAESFADHYSQARMFFHSLHPAERDHVVSAFGFELSKVELEHVRQRMLANLRNVDESLATRVASALGETLPAASKSAAPVLSLEPSPAVRLIGRMKNTVEGRSVGVLVHEGSNEARVKSIKVALGKAGATMKLIAAQRSGLRYANGTPIVADAQLAGAPSVLFDAVAVDLSEAAAATLSKESAAVQFVSDAYVHLKAIAHSEGAAALLKKAGVKSDGGTMSIDDKTFAGAAGRRYFEREIKVRMMH